MPLPRVLYVCTNNYASTTIIRMPPSCAVVSLGLIRHLFVECPCLQLECALKNTLPTLVCMERPRCVQLVVYGLLPFLHHHQQPMCA
jgi:hypothetical protein